MRRFVTLLLAILTFFQVAHATVESGLSPEQKLAVQMLADVAFRGDVAGVRLAHQRLAKAEPSETPSAVARRLYLMALADWHLSQIVMSDAKQTVDASRSAEDALAKSIALDPELADAYVLRNRVKWMLFQLGALDAKEARETMLEAYNKARMLAPEDPLVVMMEGVIKYYTPASAGGDRDQGRALLRKAVDGLAKAAPEDPHAAIWLPVLWNWYGSTFVSEGDMEAARDAFESTLKVRPDYAYVRNTLLPMTEVVNAGVVPEFDSRGWTAAGSDPTGDSRYPGLPDLLTVDTRSEDGKGRIWFRLELAEAPDPDHLGVNLALDTDGNPDNGNTWWGGNPFKYDHLLSLWVVRSSDGQYRGTLGLVSSEAATAGRFASSGDAIAFRALPSTRSILLGVNRRTLGPRDRIRMVVTVGSNTNWNDTAPNEGSYVVDLKQ